MKVRVLLHGGGTVSGTVNVDAIRTQSCHRADVYVITFKMQLFTFLVQSCSRVSKGRGGVG